MKLQPVDIIRDMYELSREPEALQRLFSEGYCYEFGLIFKYFYPEGEIYFDKDNCHYVFKYKDKFWDINGEYKPDNPNKLERDQVKIITEVNEDE